MTPAKARVHALKAALELRAGNSSPGGIICMAREFESYIAAEDYVASTPTAAMQANSEKASAGSRRK